MPILVNLILVNILFFFVTTFQDGGVTTCKMNIIVLLFLFYLPIPTRSGNEGVKTLAFQP